MQRELDPGTAESKRQSAKLRQAIRKVASPRHDVGCLARLLIQATMPHSRPKSLVHTRQNGKLTVEMIGDPRYGLPYGVYPRLLLIHLASEVFRTKSGTVELGSSLAAFLVKLGLGRTGGAKGTITKLKEQADRLFRTVISWSWHGNGYREENRAALVERHQVWWDPLKPGEPDVFDACIQLHPKLVEEILAHPIPLDMPAIRELALHGPFALDIYAWFVQRLFCLKEPLDLTWETVQQQFGCDYGRLDNFRAAFLRNAKAVKRIYPAAKVVESPSGLTLWPSAPHVPRRRSRTKQS